MVKIAIVCTPQSRFSPLNASSIDLCIHDSVKYSRLKDEIVVIGPETQAPFDGVNFRAIPRSGNTLTFWYLLNREIRKIQPQLLEVHQHMKTANAVAHANKAIPILGFRHNRMKPARNAFQYWTRSRRIAPIAHLAFVSEYIAQDFRNSFPDMADRACVALNGLDMQAYHCDLAIKTKTILYSGRVIPDKGVLEFVRAMQRVLPDYPDWKAVIMGGSNTGFETYVTQVKEEVAQLGAQGQFCGPRPFADVMRACMTASIAVVPSNWEEPFGRTALEAIACGAALISSGRGGLREVSGREGAVYVDTRQPQAIADATRQLIDDPAYLRVLQKAGRQWAEERLDIRKTVSVVDDIRHAAIEAGPIALQK